MRPYPTPITAAPRIPPPCAVATVVQPGVHRAANAVRLTRAGCRPISRLPEGPGALPPAGARGEGERGFMWVFTLYGFYSVVCARNQDGAATEHHLATLQGRFTELADYSIRETPDTDYRFRIIVPKARWRGQVSGY
jgi:hypothetical protein